MRAACLKRTFVPVTQLQECTAKLGFCVANRDAIPDKLWLVSVGYDDIDNCIAPAISG